VLDVRKNITFANKLEIPIAGLVENMSYLICPHCGEKIEIFKKGAISKTTKDMDISLLGELPLEPVVTETSDKGIFHIIESKDSDFSKSFFEIAKKIKEFVDS
jgi:ATP-binding protein involved in chromosome partitioning